MLPGLLVAFDSLFSLRLARLCSVFDSVSLREAAAAAAITARFSRRWEKPGLRPRLRLYSQSIKLSGILSPAEENRQRCVSAKVLLLPVYVCRLIISASTAGRC